jgi:predicted acylesterase/phospholipase RssA
MGTKKLAASDIRYLAMEGGGGKGFAFLGALQVLEKLKVLDQIEGYAGASAGAITAFMMSIGYTPAELKKFLNDTNFDAWWEPPIPRLMPSVGSYVPVPSETLIEAVLQKCFLASIGSITPFLILLFGSKIQKQPFLRLVTSGSYLAFLYNDMGMFPGLAPREMFNDLIRLKLVGKNVNQSIRSMTFDQHLKIFKKRLIVTGTNLSLGKTIIFSQERTPEFPVADAVRISMGLPFVFKPYVISKKIDGFPPCGTYVDGGVFNNLPFREFEGETGRVINTSPPAQGAVALASVEATNHTLLLRLGLVESNKINNFWLLFKNALKTGIMGSGESQILDRFSGQEILLDTDGLELINFNPEGDIKKAVEIRSRRKTYEYFSEEIKEIPPCDDTEEAKKDQLKANERLKNSKRGACD